MLFKLTQVAVVCALLCVSTVSRAGTVQWDFAGSLAGSNTGIELEAGGYPDVEGAPGVSFEEADIGGETAQVVSLTEGTYLVVPHGQPANGGGAYVNQYTLIMDISFPAVDQWISLYQTNSDLPISGNDGDWFVNPSGGIGISGNYGGTVVQDMWHRLALVVDLVAGTYTSYIDGVEVQQNTGLGLDGRFSLYTVDDATPYFVLFVDDTGPDEMGAARLNSFQFRDEAVSGDEIAALGGATAEGLPLPDPEPGTYFLDSFNTYASDADVAASGWEIVDENAPVEDATWTITNPGGRRNPPTLDGSPSSGGFMISDSDAASGGNSTGTGMSHDLVTPSFSTEGADTVWLHLNVVAQLNDGADAVFDIDVSIAGEDWVNAFRRVSPGRGVEPVSDNSNADGFFGQLDVDLSDFAANADDVRLRFRHFEPTDDWFVAIDDVRVDNQAPPAGGDCEALAVQDFSEGLGAMTAISLTGNVGTETWHTTDKGGRYVAGSVSGRGVNRLNHPGATPDFAIVDSDANPDPAEDEYLQTPSLNLTTFTEVFLHYKSETVVHDDAVQEVLLSLDGGATFSSTIFSYQGGGLFNSGEEPFYAERVFSVPAAAGQADVVFAFHYQSSGDKWWWAIDDVKVTGTTDNCDARECGLRSFGVAYNASENSVSGSWALLPGDEGFRVLQGARVVADGLPADATSFTDLAPPASGAGVVYTLQPLLGGAPERDCVSNEISTFLCASGFTARPDHVDRAVDLSWTAPTNIDATALELTRNGEVIATLGIDATSHVDDVSDLEAGAHVVLNYLLSPVGGSGNCATLASRAIVSTGDVRFADDFEDYETDIDLEFADWFPVDENNPAENAKWTLTNPGGRSNPPTFDGRPTSGSRFAISDSDAASNSNPTGSGMSHDLWSPNFSCANLDSVWLHMDVSAVLNNNGVCVFDVDISTDGGLNWTNTFRRVAPSRVGFEPLPDTTNADGYFGHLALDISALAANEGTVRFRVRHFEPNDDWWIAIDNVIVDDVAPPAGGPLTLFDEDFSGGLGDMVAVSLVDPPNLGVNTWTTDDPCGRSIINAGGVFPILDGRGVHRLDESFAILDSDCDPDAPEDEWLLTPIIDCSANDHVFLHWSSEIVPSSGATAEVLLSLDGGATFEAEPIFSYSAGGLTESGEDPFYARRIFEVPAAAGEDEVVFAFVYISGGDNWWWAVDDVEVTGAVPGAVNLQLGGDANQDARLDVNDVVSYVGILFPGFDLIDRMVPDAPCTTDSGTVAVLDVSGDGQVDTGDVVHLANYLFSGGSAPAQGVGCFTLDESEGCGNSCQ